MSLKFLEELNSELLKIDINNANPLEFTNIVISVLDKDAPRKKKFLRANNSSFTSKNMRKKIMQRRKFRNKFLKK